jgi:hypothetical protein
MKHSNVSPEVLTITAKMERRFGSKTALAIFDAVFEAIGNTRSGSSEELELAVQLRRSFRDCGTLPRSSTGVRCAVIS